MLYNKLNRGEEFDELKEKQEKEWAEAQAAEYRAVGVTMNGKSRRTATEKNAKSPSA